MVDSVTRTGPRIQIGWKVKILGLSLLCFCLLFTQGCTFVRISIRNAPVLVRGPSPTHKLWRISDGSYSLRNVRHSLDNDEDCRNALQNVLEGMSGMPKIEMWHIGDSIISKRMASFPLLQMGFHGKAEPLTFGSDNSTDASLS